MRERMRRLSFLALAAVLFAIPAAAQDFYRGKTVTILVGFSPGGGFDLNARVLARHIGRHVPGNPTVVVQNMAGAGSLPAVHYLDLSAAKDGTVLNIFNFGNIGDSRLHPDKIKVDFRKFNWIGSISQDLTVCYVWHTFGVKTIADLKAKPQVHMGLTGMGSSSDTNQRILKSIFGVRIQQVAGYPGSAEQRIAIERGELDGDCGAWSSIPLEWIEGRKIVPVIRSSPSIAPDMPPDVPYSVDVAPSERDRQGVRLLLAPPPGGRPLLAPPAGAPGPAARLFGPLH